MGSPTLPRRAALTGGMAATAFLAVGLAGCRNDGPARATATPSLLVPVLSATTELLAQYDAVLRRHPELWSRLSPLRNDHNRHAAALVRQLGSAAASARASRSASPSPSASPVIPDSPDTAVAALATAERSAQRQAARACLSAPARYATLLGSIAACRASHVAVLR
jgi:hypothetical protein